MDWSPGNWSPSAPTAGSVNLDFSGLTVDTTALILRDNIVGTLDINQWTLANASAAISYTRVGGTNLVNLAKVGSVDPQIIHNGGGTTQTIGIGSMGITGTGAVLQITGTSAGILNISSILTGAGGVNVNKTGAFQPGGASTFTGGFTLTGGTLILNTGATGTANNVTSGPLGTGIVNVNGGSIRSSSAGQRTILNSVQIGGDFTVGAASTLNKSITLAGTTLLTGTGVTRTITSGFSGTAATDVNTLTFDGVISEAGAGNGLTFANTSDTKIVFSAVNTYTGNTTVTGGSFTLSDNAGMKFVIGANGVNNQLTGNGTVTLEGDITFDLGGADATLGNSWNIVDNGTLTETFGANFTVAGFFSVNTTLWAKALGGGEFYNFDETTGVLSVTTVPEPATWALLAAGLTVSVVFRRRRSA